MKEFFQKYGLIIVLVIVIVGGTIWIIKNKDDVMFNFSVNDSPSNILTQLNSRYAIIRDNPNTGDTGLFFDIPLKTTVANNSSSALDLKNIFGFLSYNNVPIMQTKANSPALQSVHVLPKDTTPVTDDVRVLVNPSTIDFFSELVKGNNPKINYNISTTIFGEPKTFTNSTQINQDSKI